MDKKGSVILNILTIIIFTIGLAFGVRIIIDATAATNTEVAEHQDSPVIRGCAEAKLDAASLTNDWEAHNYLDLFGDERILDKYVGILLDDNIGMIYDNEYLYLIHINNEGNPEQNLLDHDIEYVVEIRKAGTRDSASFIAKWYEDKTAICLSYLDNEGYKSAARLILQDLIESDLEMAISIKGDPYNVEYWTIPQISESSIRQIQFP